MTNLKNLIGALALTGAVALSGCEGNYSALQENKGTRQEYVAKGDSYWKYAQELKSQYPEKLGKRDTRDIYMFLEDLNNGRELKAGGKIVLPVYD